MRFDVGRGRDRERELGSLKGGRSGEHRQDVPVAAHPERQEVERRPAIVGDRAGRVQLGGHRVGAPGRPACPVERLARPERVEVLRRDRYAGRTATGRSFLGAPDAQEDVVERLDVRERVVTRHEPIVAPPDMDRRPRDLVAERGRRQRPVDPDRGGTARHGPVGSAMASDRVAQDNDDATRCLVRGGVRIADHDDLGLAHDDVGLAHDAPARGPAIIDAARSASTATGSRRPDSIASARRSTSVRRGARK